MLFIKLVDVCSFFQTYSFIKKTDERLKVHSVLFQTAILLLILAVSFLLVVVIPLPFRHVSSSEFRGLIPLSSQVVSHDS